MRNNHLQASDYMRQSDDFQQAVSAHSEHSYRQSVQPTDFLQSAVRSVQLIPVRVQALRNRHKTFH